MAEGARSLSPTCSEGKDAGGWEAVNYVIAFTLCVACTVMTLLMESGSAKWLVISDINVAIWLFVAWLFHPRRSTAYTLHVSTTAEDSAP